MLLRIVGYLFVVLGLLCGVALVLAPLGVPGLRPMRSAWVLFPALLVVGMVLAGLGSRTGGSRGLFATVGGSLLALASAAALALVVRSLGILPVAHSVSSLWYVMIAGGAFGTLAMVVRGPSGTQPQQPPDPQ
jgi:hypothetical protein